MCSAVAAELWAMHETGRAASGLMFPAIRAGTVRVSEQESRILIAGWLSSRNMTYSVETPTTETYVQSGLTPMSARLDVTVYGSDPVDRKLNVELKAGNPASSAFAKDLEKLLREARPGLWFHTLLGANAATMASLCRKIEEGIGRALPMAPAGAATPLHFALCVLRPAQLIEFDLDLTGGWRAQLADGLRLPAASSPPVRPFSTASAGTGVTKELVFIPTVEPNSVLHLSTRGESYRLRAYADGRMTKLVVADCPTLAALLAAHPVARRADASAEGVSVENVHYWQDRVARLNLIWGAGSVAPPPTGA